MSAVDRATGTMHPDTNIDDTKAPGTVQQESHDDEVVIDHELNSRLMKTRNSQIMPEDLIHMTFLNLDGVDQRLALIANKSEYNTVHREIEMDDGSVSHSTRNAAPRVPQGPFKQHDVTMSHDSQATQKAAAIHQRDTIMTELNARFDDNQLNRTRDDIFMSSKAMSPFDVIEGSKITPKLPMNNLLREPVK